MNFYKDCLGGDLHMMQVNSTPAAAQMPAEMQDQIMHAQLTTPDGAVLMSSDMLGETGITAGNNMTVMLNCKSEEEVHSLYSKLAEGGNPNHPPKEEFWGAIFGHLVDKYGFQWMLNFDKPKA